MREVKVLNERRVFPKVRESLVQEVVNENLAFNLLPIQLREYLLNFKLHACSHHLSKEGSHQIKRISNECFTVFSLQLLINHIEREACIAQP